MALRSKQARAQQQRRNLLFAGLVVFEQCQGFLGAAVLVQQRGQKLHRVRIGAGKPTRRMQ